MKGEKRGILILGGGTMQLPAAVSAREMGLTVYVADADPHAPGRALADRFLHIDLKEEEKLAVAAKTLVSENLAGVFTAGTDFSTSVAYVAEYCSLPGISYRTAWDARDKGRMRRRFLDAGVPSPDFVCIESDTIGKISGNPEDNGHEMMVTREGKKLQFPLVVKPADSMGARGVRQVGNAQELRDAAGNALAHSRFGRIVLEEYMPGPELSIDALVYRGEIKICGIADRIILFPPFFVEMGHTMPAEMDKRTIAKATDCFIQGIKALGIENGAAKGDIKIVDGEPVAGEIAARLSGGYMSGWTYPYASGVEVTAGAIRIALGDPPGKLEPLRNWTSAERALISIPGRVANIEGIRAARQTPYVKDLFLRTEPGGGVVFPCNNLEKCGNIITQAPERSTAVKAAEDAVRNVFFRLEPENEETFRFLRNVERAWAPDAFELTEKQNLQAFRNMPYYTVNRGEADGGEHRDPFFMIPAQENETSRDWHGTDLAEALSVIRQKTADLGPLPFRLGKLFWNSFLRGGIQGGVFILETCKRYIDKGRSVDTLVERVEK